MPLKALRKPLFRWRVDRIINANKLNFPLIFITKGNYTKTIRTKESLVCVKPRVIWLIKFAGNVTDTNVTNLTKINDH